MVDGGVDTCTYSPHAAELENKINIWKTHTGSTY